VIGRREKKTLKEIKTTVLTCSRALLLKERRKLRRSMLSELKKSDSRRLKIRREHLPRSKGTVSRS
jgi:hypothetical protein